MAKAEQDLPNPEAMFLDAQPRLTFGVKAAAFGSGISVRQLDWWTRVGYIPVLQNGRHRRYSANAIKIALLIRAGIDDGMSLRRAFERARSLYPFLWENAPDEMVSDEASESGPDEFERIRAEVSRLAAELSDIGKRMDVLIAAAAAGGPAGEADDG